MTVLHFTPAEIAQRCKDNKCFHCDKFFTLGHKQHCKQLRVMEVIQEDGDSGDQGLYNAEPTISIAALTGIQPRTGRTMQVYVMVQGVILRALLDFGSTHNFVDSEVAARVGIKFSSRWVYCGSGKWRSGGKLRQLHKFEDDSQLAMDCRSAHMR
jgi:hypothetical protein